MGFGWSKNMCDPLSPPDFGHETGAMCVNEKQANLKEQQDFSREKKYLFFDGRANGEEYRPPNIHFLVIVRYGSHCEFLDL